MPAASSAPNPDLWLPATTAPVLEEIPVPELASSLIAIASFLRRHSQHVAGGGSWRV